MRSLRNIGLALLGLLIVGCGSNSTDNTQANGNAAPAGTAPNSGAKLVIAVIPKGSTHEYWKSVHEGADKAAAELGNVDIKWKGPMLENDKDSQIKVVE